MSFSCYANNGSLYENTAATYVPCNLTAVENGGHSSCCNLGDLCMTNGLCMEAANEKKGINHYWRNGCTDPTFKDPACPNYCRGKEEPDHFNAFIFYCFNPEDSFCCAPQGTIGSVTGRNTSCCNDDDLTFVADSPEVFATAVAALPRVATSTSSSSKISTSTTGQPNLNTSALAASPTAAATADATASSEPSAGLSSGAKAGIGVGITLGVLAGLAIAGAFFFARRKKAKNYKNAALLSESKAEMPPYVTYESAGTARAELEGTMMPAEMYHDPQKASRE